MSDFRVTCKIELNGEKIETYLNWTPYEINEHIIEWLQETWNKKSDKINEEIAKELRVEREREEFQEYERLKRKYEKT